MLQYITYFGCAVPAQAAGALLSKGQLAGRALPGAARLRTSLAPLQVLYGPAATMAVMRLSLPLAAPGLWRSLMYWQRLLPIVTR